jgi:hypothetical protein
MTIVVSFRSNTYKYMNIQSTAVKPVYMRLPLHAADPCA